MISEWGVTPLPHQGGKKDYSMIILNNNLNNNNNNMN